MAAELPLARIERSFNRDLPGEVTPGSAEELSKLAEIIDRSQNLAAKIGIEPVRRFGGQRAIAAHGDLILALLNIELLKLDLPVVKARAKHDHVSGAIVPAQSVKLCPNRGRAAKRIARV